MSDKTKENKPGLVAVIPGAVGNIPSKVVTDTEKEAMYQAFKRNTSLKVIGQEYGVPYRTLMRYKKDGGWVARKAADLAVMEKPEPVLNVQAYTNIMRVITTLSDKLVKAVVVGDTSEALTVRADLKSLVDCVDKLKRLHIFSEAGGVDRKEIKQTTVKVDYNAIAQMLIDYERKGIKIDDKALVKQVIDTTYSEVKEKK